MTCLQYHGQNKIMRSKQHDLNLGTNNMSINALRLPYFNIFISYIFQLQFPDKWGLKNMKRAFHKRKNASFIMLGKVFWRWSLSHWNTVLSTLVAQASVIQTDVTPSTWKYNFFFPPPFCVAKWSLQIDVLGDSCLSDRCSCLIALNGEVTLFS